MKRSESGFCRSLGSVAVCCQRGLIPGAGTRLRRYRALVSPDGERMSYNNSLICTMELPRVLDTGRVPTVSPVLEDAGPEGASTLPNRVHERKTVLMRVPAQSFVVELLPLSTYVVASAADAPAQRWNQSSPAV